MALALLWFVPGWIWLILAVILFVYISPPSVRTMCLQMTCVGAALSAVAAIGYNVLIAARNLPSPSPYTVAIVLGAAFLEHQNFKSHSSHTKFCLLLVPNIVLQLVLPSPSWHYNFLISLAILFVVRAFTLHSSSSAQDTAQLIEDELVASEAAESKTAGKHRAGRKKKKRPDRCAQQKSGTNISQKCLNQRTQLEPIDTRVAAAEVQNDGSSSPGSIAEASLRAQLQNAKRAQISAEADAEQLRMRLECCCCLDQFCDTIMMPCMHLCCSDCVMLVDSCPHCRHAIFEARRVNL